MQGLMQPTSHWLHVLAGEESKIYDQARGWERESKGRLIVRQVRGEKVRSEQALFDEFSAVWQFPPYFGDNWDALEECLADLAWLHGQAFVLVIRDARQLLGSELEKEQARFWGLLARVAQGWNEPSEGSARSFQVIVHCEPQDRLKLQEKLAPWGLKSALANTSFGSSVVGET